MLTWTIAAEHTLEVGKESSSNMKETVKAKAMN